MTKFDDLADEAIKKMRSGELTGMVRLRPSTAMLRRWLRAPDRATRVQAYGFLAYRRRMKRWRSRS